LTKAIFFDRDGTLLVESGYVSHPTQIAPYAWSAEALRIARRHGFLLIVVTNQSGVGRGWLSEQDLALVHARMRRLFAAQGIEFDGVYYCPHHPQATIAAYRRICTCRKPGIALGEVAVQRFAIDVGRSFAIGDKATDIRFGKALGLGACLVRTGFGYLEEEEVRTGGMGDVHVAADVLEGVEWIIEREAGL
jgi:D-glycero-D-manno-heptose 1,7-bisphosphate phosphatase